MTAGMIIGLILLPLVWMLTAAAQKKHREETGVTGPMRSTFRNIRRNARKNGTSEAQEYDKWLQREQRKLQPKRPRKRRP